jgi:hypothetical protein
MAYQNKGSYNNNPKSNYSKPAQQQNAAPKQQHNKSDERPVGSLMQVVKGAEGEKDTYLDIGGLWERTKKSDGKKFFVATGMKGTAFEGAQFLVRFND